jgi:hypothetical protein
VLKDKSQLSNNNCKCPKLQIVKVYSSNFDANVIYVIKCLSCDYSWCEPWKLSIDNSIGFQHNEENHRQVKNIFLDVLSIQKEMIADNGQN